ncbi:hypothetical protein [Enterobacillus tribolii]|uniref:hypothetical protein n=1 Tax=Enterobacillus tribolii TaxID=1487935 RepID=UPI0013C35AB8|nr:hypothetical protein [Enterobacillus tribolii]
MMDDSSLYWRLRAEGDLDLLYFAVESYAAPFVKVIQIKNIEPEIFNEINDHFLGNIS